MKSIHKRIPHLLARLSGAAALLVASSSAAATFQWTNTAASASFVNPANWTNTASPFGNGTPVAGDVGINNVPGAAAVIGTGDSVAATTLDALSGIISVTDGEVNATTMRATGSNGLVSISGGTVNLVNLQITGNYGIIAISGGSTTVTADSRIGANNAIWNVSGGTLNLSKHTVGSAAAGNTNNVMTVSGTAVVTQNQGTGGGVNRELWLGGNNAGSGTLILKDNASWTSSAANGNTDVIIGRTSGGGQSPVGTLTLQDNASFTVQSGEAAAKVIQLAGGPNDGATGILNLNGGNLATIGIARARSGTSTGTININGGKITALADSVSFFRNLPGTGGANSINLLAGGLTFDTGGFSVVITNVLSGPGGLTKQGGGVLTVAGANTYTGATVVSSDTLRLTGVADINNSSAITVENFSTLEITNGNSLLFTSGSLTLNNGTVTADFSATNLTVGTFGTAGFANNINVVALPNLSSLPAQIPLLKYTTAAPGLVDGNNGLTALNATLPTVGNPVGYLTNNVANKSIDLVITSMVLTPVITKQPAPDSAYAGYFAHFSVELELTNAPSYQWRKGGSPLSNGGAYSGVNTAVIKISNVTASELGSYDVIVGNVSGSVTSSPATLTLSTPAGYEAAAVAAGPVALYMFDDLGDVTFGNAAAFDYAGDLDGVYGSTTQNGLNGIIGPTPGDGFSGFDSTNIALRTLGFTAGSRVTIPPLNLNTNTVTITAWMNPGTPAANAGVVFCRGAGTTAGLNFTSQTDALARRTLGYTWNNEGGTFNWNSQLAPAPGLWSFVALVITPTNATVYIFDADGVRASSQPYAHVNQSFSTNSTIGDDAFSGGNRQFDGSLDSVGIYASALSQSQLEALYTAASGDSTFAPIVWASPASQARYEQQNVTFAAGASGSEPLTYQWQTTDGLNYFDVNNGGRFSGATTPSLTISNLLQADNGTMYVLVANNAYGSATSVVATLTVNPVGPAEAITNSIVQPGGSDWNTATAWSDGLAASVSAASKPGSTYHVVPGGGLRTPNTTGNATFPGHILTLYGSGGYDTSFANTGGLILKGQSPGGTFFNHLVMNGGQIISFTDFNNPSIITGGQMDIQGNTPISGGGSTTSGRSITLAAQLTGNGTIEYRGFANATFQPTFVTALNVSGSSNTFSGPWNILGGTLVGSSAGSLGTNTITVATNAAVQASYDLNNPDGALVLNGRFNLTHHHTFKTATINGTVLSAGTYSFAQLNTAYPDNFPASWTGQTGAESLTTGAGSITVLTGSVTPISLGSSWNGAALTLTWPAGWQLLEATNVLGPWTTNNVATSPLVVNPSEPQKFFRLQAQ